MDLIHPSGFTAAQLAGRAVEIMDSFNAILVVGPDGMPCEALETFQRHAMQNVQIIRRHFRDFVGDYVADKWPLCIHAPGPLDQHADRVAAFFIKALLIEFCHHAPWAHHVFLAPIYPGRDYSADDQFMRATFILHKNPSATPTDKVAALIEHCRQAGPAGAEAEERLHAMLAKMNPDKFGGRIGRRINLP